MTKRTVSWKISKPNFNYRLQQRTNASIIKIAFFRINRHAEYEATKKNEMKWLACQSRGTYLDKQVYNN